VLGDRADEDSLSAAAIPSGLEGTPATRMTLYAATIFLGAFLLFQIQPLIAKIIMPWFGGSAAVWSAALLFFQSALLAGYAYAHCVIRYLKAGAQRAVHLVLLAVTCALLPILPSPAWKPSGVGDPTVQIFVLLAATVGLPYFLLAATSPLLQAWYVRRSGGATPYRLFALSNLGSMLGLLSFPLLIEPQLNSRQQAYGWSGAYVLFALLCATVAWASRKGSASVSRAETANIVPAARPSLSRLLLWVAFAACGSTLLVAVTNHLSQNVAPIPLLWVVPLAVYLTTFILAFESDRAYQRRIFLPLLAPTIGLMAYLISANQGNVPLPLMIPAFTFGLFTCCMVCHGEVARSKPAAPYLTVFYLMVSLGGALGGLFVALIAPRLFPTYLELPVGLVACATLATVALWTVRTPTLRPRVVRFALASGVAILAVSLAHQEYLNDTGYRLMARNFYGVLRVGDYDYPHARILWNGTINHGSQVLDESMRYRATTYYGPNSGVGRALRVLEARGPIRVGIVGLGAGVLSTYGRTGDIYRFYEINPLVVQIAQTQFTFLAHSTADTRVLLGDARLVLERQESQQFDLLAVDAFSSDAVPIHLLTREALAVYFRHLKPDGILALHVSNRYLNLVPVIARAVQNSGKQAMVVHDDGHEASYLSASIWALVASDTALFKAPSFETADMTEAMAPPGFRPWTDSYSNVVQVLALTDKGLSVVRAQARKWTIVPGQSVGPVRLGVNIRDVAAVLGPQVKMDKLPDGNIAYLWFAPPRSAGLGVRTTGTGKVDMIWVQNDGRYVVKGRLHAGSTEAEVREALGAPSRESINPRPAVKTLWYHSLGVWFSVPLDAEESFYNTVYAIGVTQPK
jgi:SAM-dependent methyltransferase